MKDIQRSIICSPNKNETGRDIVISYWFALDENNGTTSERGWQAVSVSTNHILLVVERNAHVICRPLYWLRALPLVLEYAAAERLHIEFNPTVSYIDPSIKLI
jgi:hypothetical protein